jgi:cellulose synthase/poly-beta-1,6-N-acetylglucosamine synthase-like glycosyltransferase
MKTIELFFFASLALLIYTYIGYGIIIKLITFFKRDISFPDLKAVDLPYVTHIIAAYNEEDILEEKIYNSLSLSYPKEKLKTIIVTDGSTDATSQIVAKNPDIVHYHLTKRCGKLAAVARIIPTVISPIIVFSDANAMLNKEAVQNLIKHFQNNMVGAVAGEKIVLSDKTDDATSGESIYWKYESWLKKLDYRLKSVVGAAGELFALRTHLYHPPQANMLIEDFITSMKIAKNGYRVAYEPNAFATELASKSIDEEVKRKVRISAGGLQAIHHLREILNPFKHGILTFQYVSHRVLRWTLAPIALVVVFVTNLILIQTDNWIFQLMFIGQSVFYLMALGGFYFEKHKVKFKGLYVPFYFVFMNISVFLSLMKIIAGDYDVTWEKAARKQRTNVVT